MTRDSKPPRKPVGRPQRPADRREFVTAEPEARDVVHVEPTQQALPAGFVLAQVSEQVAEPAAEPEPQIPSTQPDMISRRTQMAVSPFKSPFGDFDFTKVLGEFKVPMLDVESFIDLQRRNVQAFTVANQTAFEAFKGIAQRQADMLKVAMEDFSKASSELFAVGTLEEKTAKNADLVKKSYETSIANMKELAELYAKGNADAFEAINKRVTEALEEIKALSAKKQ
jgi:phasin family protein